MRAPASHCGLFGIRPTHGRVSIAAAPTLAPTVAVKTTATVGAGVGGGDAAHSAGDAGRELGDRDLGVAVIEYKLIAELHEVYGLRAGGAVRERATVCGPPMDPAARYRRDEAVHARCRARHQHETRAAPAACEGHLRNLPTLTPFMVGAAIGAVMNRRDTRRLAERVRSDLAWSTSRPGACWAGPASGRLSSR